MTSSTASKELRGSLRADRIRRIDAGKALRRLPAPPDGLPPEAAAAWRRFGSLAIGLGTLTAADVALLELLARTWASAVELEQVLARDGLILTSGEVQKAHPAIAALDRSRNLAHRLLADLGLSPPGRERISITPPARNNPFTKFWKPPR